MSAAQIKTYKKLIEIAKKGDRYKLIAEIECLIEKLENAVPKLDISKPFAEFWSAYPKRDGCNPRKVAEQSFRKCLERGTDPQTIIAGVKRFGTIERKRIGTTFIPMASTWLNQERWRDYLNGHTIDPTKPTPPLDPAEVRRLQALDEIRSHLG